MNHAEIAHHDALGVNVADVPRDCQRRFESIQSVGEPAMHLIEQSEVAQCVRFGPPIAVLLGQGERCFTGRARLVHEAQLGVQDAQVGEYVSLAVRLSDSNQGTRHLVVGESVVHPTHLLIEAAEQIVGPTLKCGIARFARDVQSRRGASTGRIQAAFVDVYPT